MLRAERTPCYSHPRVPVTGHPSKAATRGVGCMQYAALHTAGRRRQTRSSKKPGGEGGKNNSRAAWQKRTDPVRHFFCCTPLHPRHARHNRHDEERAGTRSGTVEGPSWVGSATGPPLNVHVGALAKSEKLWDILKRLLWDILKMIQEVPQTSLRNSNHQRNGHTFLGPLQQKKTQQ